MRGGPRVVRLTAADHAVVQPLFARQPGQGIFIESSLLSYGYDHLQVRLWGQFMAPGHADLAAVLMITTAGCSIFAPEPVDIAPLGAVVARERPTYVMGPDELVAQATASLFIPAHRVEFHHFAELPRQRFVGRRPAAAGVVVRRAERADVADLAALYLGSEGFEGLAIDRIANIMQQRVTHYRTYLARDATGVVAAASTSAETPSGAMIGGVWTAPEQRGRGHATAVVSALCADLLHEHRRPYLFYLTDNKPAGRLYARLGFRIIAEWRVDHLV